MGGGKRGGGHTLHVKGKGRALSPFHGKGKKGTAEGFLRKGVVRSERGIFLPLEEKRAPYREGVADIVSCRYSGEEPQECRFSAQVKKRRLIGWGKRRGRAIAVLAAGNMQDKRRGE